MFKCVKSLYHGVVCCASDPVKDLLAAIVHHGLVNMDLLKKDTGAVWVEGRCGINAACQLFFFVDRLVSTLHPSSDIIIIIIYQLMLEKHCSVPSLKPVYTIIIHYCATFIEPEGV